ncbi:MAG: hypothetical protein ABL999_03520 [Pyrinomonadaceae bacterium]
MKKKFSTCILAAISLGMLSLSILQLGTQVVKADGCPQNPFPSCICSLSDAQSVQYGDQTHWYCTYDCFCGGGGGAEPFFIIREYDFVE